MRKVIVKFQELDPAHRSHCCLHHTSIQSFTDGLMFCHSFMVLMVLYVPSIHL